MLPHSLELALVLFLAGWTCVTFAGHSGLSVYGERLQSGQLVLRAISLDVTKEMPGHPMMTTGNGRNFFVSKSVLARSGAIDQFRPRSSGSPKVEEIIARHARLQCNYRAEVLLSSDTTQRKSYAVSRTMLLSLPISSFTFSGSRSIIL